MVKRKKKKERDGGRLMFTIKEIGGRVQFGGIVHQGNPQDGALESKVCNALFKYYSGFFEEYRGEPKSLNPEGEILTVMVIKPSDLPIGTVGSEAEGIHPSPNYQHLRPKGEPLNQGEGPTLKEQMAEIDSMADKIVK